MPATATVLAAGCRFPLVRWAKPACLPLLERLAEITTSVETAQREPGQALDHAATALNLAALVASDCGLPALAAELCWKHIDAYCSMGRPMIGSEAMQLLGPIGNLARLRLRAHDGDHAVAQLQDLLRAVRTGSDLILDNRTLPLAQVVADKGYRRQMVQWAWMQLLADGTKALTLAGRWTDAAQLAKTYNGIGNHLLEGRQAAIIASLTHRDSDTARETLAQSIVSEPWEREAAACLAVLCAPPDAANDAVDSMATEYQAGTITTEHADYRARLGVTVAALAHAHDPDLADDVLRQAAAEAAEANNGYAAREILRHRPAADVLTTNEQQHLTQIVDAAGLAAGRLVGPLLTTIREVSTQARATLDHTLSHTDSTNPV
jgi:hypothetical protein